MKRTSQLLATVSAGALIFVSSAPAMAEGTGAGETISNTVSVQYSVGGILQTEEQATDSFEVDRKINVVVAAVGTSPTVSANQQNVVRQFTVQNLSNDVAGFELTAAQNGGAAGLLENITVFDDLDNDGEYDAGEEITFFDSLAVDATRNVWVVFDVAANAGNNVSADIVLTADAFVAGSGSLGAEYEATDGANTAGIDTVLADGAGETDSQFEGDFSAAHTITTAAAALSVTKTSRVISDPVVGTGNGSDLPNPIPGAVVEYCIAVTNGPSAATATGVVVNDPIDDSRVEFLPNIFGGGATPSGDIVVDGSIDGVTGFCTGGTATDKTYSTATTTVNNGLSDIAPGETRSLYFRVQIR